MTVIDPEIKCPTCGREDFVNVGSMFRHHAVAHKEQQEIRELIISWLQTAAKHLDRAPKIDDVDNLLPVSHQTITKRFGGWNAVLKASGFDVHVERNVTEEELLDEMRSLASGGEPPTSEEMQEKGRFSHKIYQSRFGSWNAAVEAAGFESNSAPGSGEFRNCHTCGAEIYIRKGRLDAYNNHFCSDPCRYEHHSGETHPAWEGGVHPRYGKNWREQRQAALIRDQARCSDCGVSERQHYQQYGRSLDVHHVNPAKNFTEDEKINHHRANTLDNLVTLCIVCHQKWEKMSPLRPSTTT